MEKELTDKLEVLIRNTLTKSGHNDLVNYHTLEEGEFIPKENLKKYNENFPENINGLYEVPFKVAYAWLSNFFIEDKFAESKNMDAWMWHYYKREDKDFNEEISTEKKGHQFDATAFSHKSPIDEFSIEFNNLEKLYEDFKKIIHNARFINGPETITKSKQYNIPDEYIGQLGINECNNEVKLVYHKDRNMINIVPIETKREDLSKILTAYSEKFREEVAQEVKIETAQVINNTVQLKYDLDINGESKYGEKHYIATIGKKLNDDKIPYYVELHYNR